MNSAGYTLGYLIGFSMPLIIGIALVIFGLTKRSRAQKPSPAKPLATPGWPAYPQPYQYQAPYQYHGQYQYPQPPRPKSGGAMIWIGAALIGLWLLGALGNATADARTHSAQEYCGATYLTGCEQAPGEAAT